MAQPGHKKPLYILALEWQLSSVILAPASSPSRCPVLGWKSVLGVVVAKRKAVVEALNSPSSLSTVCTVVTGAFEVPEE